MRYRCTQCGAVQQRGLIPDVSQPIRFAVFHGVAVGICGNVTKYTFLHFGVEIEGWKTGLLSVAVCGLLLVFYYIAVILIETFLVGRRKCATCGRIGLSTDGSESNSPGNSDVASGDLYALRNECGDYTVVKVLVVDAVGVHVRSYANRFDKCPEQVSSSELSLGGFGDPVGFGIGHMPLSRVSFAREDKTLVGRETVSYEELSGYRIWSGEHSIDENAGGPDGLPSG